ncbi:alcohol dehydrogenase catalytic domain-containing protein [Nesterenkonia aurantiaca]|uniref:alcohol dehydrogenase catalytic domain-containing protein n=1 Tax=Nesterenkonia aurantiaca TaxID=1436010 RepID=UPI001FB957EE|nr:alcohol dehydrogenase catalytic domain-containing protein [Nesterenkonia aurantiaca]
MGDGRARSLDRKASPHEGSRRQHIRIPTRDRRARRAAPAGRPGAGASGDLRPLSHRHPCRPGRLAGEACGQCRYCIDGRETLCESQRNSGCSVHGAFAEYAVASSKYVVAVPDGMRPIEAAPLSCAGVTPIRRSRSPR